LAKFKKKKSEPTADPNDSKKESVEDIPTEVPAIEKSEPIPEDP